MKFGAMVLGEPPWNRVVDLSKRLEAAGFDYVFLVDSHVLWMDCWSQFPVIARETSTIKMGPLVTNPATRDWTVLASTLATLNEVSDGRVVCGTGRGDSALRTIGLAPASLAEWEESIPFVRDLASGREVVRDDKPIQFPWASGHDVEMWGAAYGPKALGVVGRQCDGFVMQLADPDVFAWALGYVTAGAVEAGRDPRDVQTVVAAPPYIVREGEDRAHAHAQLRWFAGSVANHISDMINVHGAAGLPNELTEFVAGRPEYDYRFHGKPQNPNTEYVPDAINERFCVMGTADEHVDKLRTLEENGVDVFVGYLIHDRIEETIDVYGEAVIPRLRESE
jgi:probable F420-dependent oxidoreductase